MPALKLWIVLNPQLVVTPVGSVPIIVTPEAKSYWVARPYGLIVPLSIALVEVTLMADSVVAVGALPIEGYVTVTVPLPVPVLPKFTMDIVQAVPALRSALVTV
ncbi:Uncharacterised protein [uncultured archaeon]|nr:Uncharacterised protein [uncultured archaeon]